MPSYVAMLPGFLINIYYRLRRIKVTEELTRFSTRCLSCNSESYVPKHYGVVHFVCKCGNRSKIYTGKDLHILLTGSNQQKKATFKTDTARERKVDRYEVFRKHIDTDLQELYKCVSDRRNVINQIDKKRCSKVLRENGLRGGYRDVLLHLKSFLDLEETSTNLVWEPLKEQRTLSDVRNKISIMGTTYVLPSIASRRFYTVYLNPKYIDDEDSLFMVLAHELTHVYADFNGIKFISPDKDRGDKEYSEQMTDLLAVVLGMGSLMDTFSDDDDSDITGYLTNRMIRESKALWKSEFLSGKNRIIKAIVSCMNCSQKLRVPVNRKGLRIACPKCGKELAVLS